MISYAVMTRPSVEGLSRFFVEHGVKGIFEQGAYQSYGAEFAELRAWVSEGRIKVQEDIVAGLENTPQALIGLLAGENRGKRMVKV